MVTSRRRKTGERMTPINATVKPQTREAIHDWAWRLRKTPSSLIDDILCEWLRAQEAGNKEASTAAK